MPFVLNTLMSRPRGFESCFVLKFILLINVNMQVSMINTTSERLKARSSSFVGILVVLDCFDS